MGININKELDTYLDEFLSKDDFDADDILNISHKLEMVIENIYKINNTNTKLYKLIQKQINNTNNLISNEDSYRNLSNVIEECKLNERIQRNKEKSLVKGIVNILDSIEWFLEFLQSISEEKLVSTIDINRRILKRELDLMNISETTFVGDSFNEELQICIGNKSDETLINNQISTVIKKGYKYQGEIIRYAEVIVVNNKEV